MVLPACSVKEDRVECPCWLRVKMDQAFSETGIASDKLRLMIYSSGLYYAETLGIDPDEGYHEVTVPKGEIVLVAAYGTTKDNEYQMIEYGRQSDSLYVAASHINATREIVDTDVVLYKQFSTMSIRFGNEKSGVYFDDQVNYKLVVNGNTNGICLTDLAPVSGAFKAEPRPDDKGQYLLRIPRQGDDKLSLDIYTESGSLINTYPIGQMIRDSGFDWNKTSLDDVIVTIDLTQISSGIDVADWDVVTITSLI